MQGNYFIGGTKLDRPTFNPANSFVHTDLLSYTTFPEEEVDQASIASFTKYKSMHGPQDEGGEITGLLNTTIFRRSEHLEIIHDYFNSRVLFPSVHLKEFLKEFMMVMLNRRLMNEKKKAC